MSRKPGLWAASLLFVAPVTLAATLTITLKNGRTVTYLMNEVESIVYADDGRGGGSSSNAGSAPVAVNLTGGWKSSDVSIGRIALTQSGSTLSGTYHNGDSRITGSVHGNVFSGQWSGGRSRRGGNMTLTMQRRGRALEASWSFSTSHGTAASFTATCG